ncbi:MAG TPA: TrkA C-terminal domain-containing protein, partial [Chloroflexota bacterium]
LPAMPQTPAPFVIVGMMALFGGIAHAPLAVMLMVAEMTGNLSMLAPAMVAVGVATALVGDTTIYRSQLPNRASSPTHRVHFAYPLLSSLQVHDAMGPNPAPLRTRASVRDAIRLLAEQAATVLAVVDERGRFAGVLTRSRLERVPESDRPDVQVSTVLDEHLDPLAPALSLDDALEQLSEYGVSWLPVVEDGRLLGGLGVRDAVRAYKATLQHRTRRGRSLPEDTSVFEVKLARDSPVVGSSLREANLPPSVLVVAIHRAGATIFPRADSRLEAGDVLTVVAEPTREAELRQFFDATQA